MTVYTGCFTAPQCERDKLFGLRSKGIYISDVGATCLQLCWQRLRSLWNKAAEVQTQSPNSSKHLWLGSSVLLLCFVIVSYTDKKYNFVTWESDAEFPPALLLPLKRVSLPKADENTLTVLMRKDAFDVEQRDEAPFVFVSLSKRGGSFTGVLADEADQRGRPAERSSGCLWNGPV